MTFVLGVTLPLLRFERLFFFTEEPALLAIIGALWRDGEWALAALVTTVSIVFPVAKLLLAHVAAIERRAAPTWLAALSKWSMTDVLLVALAIVAAKTSGLASAGSEPGVWFYAGSALMAYAATVLSRRANEKGPPDSRSDGP